MAPLHPESAPNPPDISGVASTPAWVPLGSGLWQGGRTANIACAISPNTCLPFTSSSLSKNVLKKTPRNLPKDCLFFFSPLSFCPSSSAAAGDPAGLTLSPSPSPPDLFPNLAPHIHTTENMQQDQGLESKGGLKPSPTNTHSGTSPWVRDGLRLQEQGKVKCAAQCQGGGEEEGGIPCFALIEATKCGTRDSYPSFSSPPDCLGPGMCSTSELPSTSLESIPQEGKCHIPCSFQWPFPMH